MPQEPANVTAGPTHRSTRASSPRAARSSELLQRRCGRSASYLGPTPAGNLVSVVPTVGAVSHISRATTRPDSRRCDLVPRTLLRMRHVARERVAGPLVCALTNRLERWRLTPSRRRCHRRVSSLPAPVAQSYEHVLMFGELECPKDDTEVIVSSKNLSNRKSRWFRHRPLSKCVRKQVQYPARRRDRAM